MAMRCVFSGRQGHHSPAGGVGSLGGRGVRCGVWDAECGWTACGFCS